MKTITYLHKKAYYTVTVGFPYTSNNASIAINGVLCDYPKSDKLVKNIDTCIVYAINKYNAHKKLGLLS